MRQLRHFIKRDIGRSRKYTRADIDKMAAEDVEYDDYDADDDGKIYRTAKGKTKHEKYNRLYKQAEE